MNIAPLFPVDVSANSRVAQAWPRRGEPRLRPIAAAILMLFAATVRAAPPGTVLPAGTIPTGGVVSSGQATIAAPVVTSTGQLLKIHQDSQRAIIDWQTFDIAKGSQVHFNQPNSAAEMLNRIHDANPTLIQGQLTANGRVYLVNQNGILFDRTSQVDVHTLFASSLDIPESAFNNGLSSSSGALVASGSLRLIVDASGQPLTDLEGRPLTNAVTNYGVIRSVEVDPESGSAIVDQATGKVREPGGAIMLFAPRAENRGQITASNGQVVLAAGEQVYLSTYFDENNPDPVDPSGYLMRGMVVKVQAGSDPLNLSKMVAANFGGIRTDRGNTTLTGMIVNQAGRVSANSAATLNGSIWLLADGSKGTLTTAQGSVTEALPTSDGTTLAEDQDYSQFRPVIRMQGGTVDHNGSIVAPGGSIDITAGRLFLGAGSTLSTAGLWSDLPYASSQLEFKLTSFDLRDSPVQKNGFLLGQKVTVDALQGSPLLFDISEKVAGIQRSVSEKAAAAGDITIHSDEFISAPGSVVDLSGGGYRYAGGTKTTTYLVSGGRLYDIRQAPTDLAYTGVVNVNSKVPGYVQGKDAGTLAIDANQVVMGGSFLAGVTVGQNQRSGSAMPQAGKLVLGSSNEDGTNPVYALQKVVLSNAPVPLPADFDAYTPLPSSLLNQVSLPANLFGGHVSSTASSYVTSGFGALEVRARDEISVPEGALLDLGPQGSALFISRLIDIEGDMTAEGGSISLNARATVGGNGDPEVILGSNAAVSVAGGWINDAPGVGKGAVVPNVINGGSITLKGNLSLETGSVINASGGAYYSSAHKLEYGKGGAISLQGSLIDGNPRSEEEIGRIDLGSTLLAYSGTQGGALSLGAGQILIGSDSIDPLAISLDPGFFVKGGFANYTLTGFKQIDVSPDTPVTVVADSRLLDPMAFYKPTGTDFDSISSFVRQDAYLRGPTSLVLAAPTEYAVGINVGTGAVISTDALGSIAISSRSKLEMDGALIAPGGTISLTLDQPVSGLYGGETLEVGPHAAISTAGTFIPEPGLRGEILGKVLPGGSITISARKNDLHIAKGALVDVSGASHVVDVYQYGNHPGYARQTVNSEAGAIAIRATENAVLDGTFSGHAAPTVAGGTFDLSLDFHNDPPNDASPDPRLKNYSRIIHVSELPTTFTPAAETRQAAISVGQIESGGFDRVLLNANGQIAFEGDVQLSPRALLRLDTPEINVADGGLVQLASAQVEIRNTLNDFRSSTLLDEAGTRIPVSTHDGAGQLDVTAYLLSLAGHLTVNGAQQVNLSSQGDLRFDGFPVGYSGGGGLNNTLRGLSGSLTTEADLVLQASQVYPATLVDYTLSVANIDSAGNKSNVGGGQITVLPGSVPAGPVLSAGGSLTLVADTILHKGILKAPLGSIDLQGGSLITLAPDSIISASAKGLTVPFGGTRDIGQSLWYGDLAKTFDMPSKRITIDAPAVSIEAGSLIDNSGGGEILATEWVPGIGGSTDVLAEPGTFAILPGVSFPVLDSYLQGLASSAPDAAAPYDVIRLADNSMIGGGTFALLPAYYALLPGAYLVHVGNEGDRITLAPGTVASQIDGSLMVASKLGFAGTNAGQSTWSGVIIEPGLKALRQAEYRQFDSQYFADLAAANDRAMPILPGDGGHLSIGATQQLQFQGKLLANPFDGGAIGQVDFYSSRIALVSDINDSTVPTGYVGLLSGELSSLDASVMLGGIRTNGPDGQAVKVVTQDLKVDLEQGDSLHAPEIILAATDTLDVSATSSLRADGASFRTGGTLTIEPDDAGKQNGALLRLSASEQVSLVRSGALDFSRGTLKIAEGARLEASGSMILDATHDLDAAGELVLPDDGALSIGAGNIRLGAAPKASGSLVLGADQLARLEQVRDLTLRSYTTVDVYGNVALGRGVGNLIIDAVGITGTDTAEQANALFDYGQISLTNIGGAAFSSTATGTGTLNLDADNVMLGKGNKTLAGFENVNLNAGALTLQDTGALNAAGDLAIDSGYISAGKSANQQINACTGSTCDETTPESAWRNIAITRSSADVSGLENVQAGGRLLIAGKSVDFAGLVAMPSGRVKMEAHGTSNTDGVYLRNDSVIDLSSFEKTYLGLGEFNQYASAGRLELSANYGSIEAEAGSSVNLNGGLTGGDAGILTVNASRGRLHLDGGITAVARSDFSQGSVNVDVASLDNFSSLNAALSAGGFAGARYMRARTGDIEVNGPGLSPNMPADVVKARSVQLVADQGSILFGGAIDASGMIGGGSAELMAGKDIKLLDGSVIDARGLSDANGAADPYSNGGSVGLYTRGGEIVFADSAAIDVSADAGGKSKGGEIVFSAPWALVGGSPLLAMNLGGNVDISGPAGSGKVVIEGFRSYAGVANTSTAASATAGNPVWNDYKAFMQGANAVRSSISLPGLSPSDIAVRSGIELVNSGNMSVNSAWDLTGANWNIGEPGGRLVLRAEGNLTVSNYLGLPSDTGALNSGWDMQLVAGANLASVDPLATTPSSSSGDLILASANSKLRTTDGDIQLVAGRDVVIANTGATVYTTGLSANAGDSTNRYLGGGGDILVRAGRNITGSSGGAQWLNDWLRRNTPAGNTTSAKGKAGGWWADRSKFAQGLATFGDGDISVSAPGSIQGVSASVASSAAVSSDAKHIEAVYGGGSLLIDAGENVSGGQFLVGRGDAVINAGGSVGAYGSGADPVIWLQGYSLDPALEKANARVEALGDVSIATVANPTVMPLSSNTNNNLEGYRNIRLTFFSYAPDAGASLVSVGGDVSIGNKAPKVGSLKTDMSSVLPPRFAAVSLQGDVHGSELFDPATSTTDLYQYPDTNGKFLVLAQNSVHDLALRQSDVLPDLLPQPNVPAVVSGTNSLSLTGAGFQPTNDRLVAPSNGTGYHYGAIALDGSVYDSRLYFPQRSVIHAGHDVSNVMLDLQNLGDEDTSIVSAGRDIRYTSLLTNNTSWYSLPHIWISGPGRLVTQAGRNVSMGVADSIDAGGSNFNFSLPSTDSAALTVIAGYSLPLDQDHIDGLFETLREAGSVNDQAAANSAIEPLFGDLAANSGSITMYQSRISTEGGSPIDLLVPAGDINVGLPTPAGGNIGILTNFGGGIRAYLSGDMNVNLSKVATLQGGDILLYTSQGNIDAGRGPRDSRTTQPPRLVDEIDPETKLPTGVTLLIPPLDVGGSGIRTLSFDPDGAGPLPKPAPGNVFLFAPTGTIDAGEAGVSSAGNVTVVASQVLNGENFSAGGSSVGVPSASAAPAPAPVSTETGSTNKAVDSIAQASNQLAQSSKDSDFNSFRPSFLTVEVLGFGGESVECGKDDDACRKRKNDGG